MTRPRTAVSGRLGSRGTVMVMAVIGLTVLLFLTVTLLALSLNLSGTSTRDVRDAQALAAAEAACSRGVVMLEQGTITALPYQQLNIAIGSRKMDLRVVALNPQTSGAYQLDRYEIRGTGYSGSIRRVVALGGTHDTFLRYSRFLASGGLSYGAGANITGEIFAGGNLTLSGSPITFGDNVTVTGTVQNRSYGTFRKNVITGAAAIALTSAVDITHYRSLAQSGGLYYSTGTPVIDLGLFDFSTSPAKYNGTALPSNFNGVVFAEGDLAVKGMLQGQSVTLVAGSDIIVNDNIRTGCTKARKATLSPLSFNAATNVETIQTQTLSTAMSGIGNAVPIGVSGTKWQRLTVYIKQDGTSVGVGTLERPAGNTSNLTSTTMVSHLNLDPSAHTYTAEAHYWSNGTGASTVSLEVDGGDPVNAGLVASDYVYISQYAPRVLNIEAALLAKNHNWRPVDDTDTNDSDASHVKCHGVWDLDGDGTIETSNGDGWNETNVGDNTWTLNIMGPIITQDGGSAGAWEYQGSTQNKTTRHYNYDPDIVNYPPPQFPVILSRWEVLYWRKA